MCQGNGALVVNCSVLINVWINTVQIGNFGLSILGFWRSSIAGSFCKHSSMSSYPLVRVVVSDWSRICTLVTN